MCALLLCTNGILFIHVPTRQHALSDKVSDEYTKYAKLTSYPLLALFFTFQLYSLVNWYSYLGTKTIGCHNNNLECMILVAIAGTCRHV